MDHVRINVNIDLLYRTAEMSKSLVDLAPRHAVREKNTSIKDINKVKQGRFNEGFNAEPIAFCICILYFAFRI